MQIIYNVTLHNDFEEAHLFIYFSQTTEHTLGGLVINHSLRTCMCNFSYILLLYAAK